MSVFAWRCCEIRATTLIQMFRYLSRIFEQPVFEMLKHATSIINTLQLQASHHATSHLEIKQTNPTNTLHTHHNFHRLHNYLLKNVNSHFFFPFALAFEPVPFDDTLTALDVCPELALLPFFTTSSCLFCSINMLVAFAIPP